MFILFYYIRYERYTYNNISSLYYRIFQHLQSFLLLEKFLSIILWNMKTENRIEISRRKKFKTVKNLRCSKVMNVFEFSSSFWHRFFRDESRALEEYSRHYPHSFATVNIFHVELLARWTYVLFTWTHYRLRHHSTKPFSQFYSNHDHLHNELCMNRIYSDIIDC